MILSQLLLLIARGTLLAAYLMQSLFLFVLEAVIEGISACLSSAQAVPISIQSAMRTGIFQRVHMQQTLERRDSCSVRQVMQ